MDEVIQYINKNWENTIRYNPEDDGTLIGLPYPYIVPCCKERFQELYYWDTYFACRGLALSGRKTDVRHNLLNFFYEIDKFGFIPNGSRTYFLNRSQPPFLGALIKLSISLYPGDEELKHQAYQALSSEISFWDRCRLDRETGLYHYGSNHTEAELQEYFKLAVIRHGAAPDEKDAAVRKQMALTTLAEAESGWDFSARFGNNCHNCAAIDLNSLLWLSFSVLAELASDAGEKPERWLQRQADLAAAMRKYCLRSDNLFTDYDLQKKMVVPLTAAASFFPLWVGLATAQEAAAACRICCAELEYPFGISATEKTGSSLRLQWEYPNGWPCLQLISFEALERYGFTNAAVRLAAKYCAVVDKNFELTGNLWEKYNVTDGSTRVAAEYEMPAMMGWTAGTYLTAAELLAKYS